MPLGDAKASISRCAPQSHRVLAFAMQDLAAEVQEQLEGTSVYLVGMMGRYGRSSAHFTCALLFLQYAAPCTSHTAAKQGRRPVI